jgi:hypothetical protein
MFIPELNNMPCESTYFKSLILFNSLQVEYWNITTKNKTEEKELLSNFKMQNKEIESTK